jgi:single-strand DNA-binding protein
MNKVNLIGRLCKEVEARYSQGENPLCVARYSLAVDRKYKKEGEQSADFINCVAFGKSGEFAEKFLKKGMKIAVSGRIQTGSYTDKDGKKVYTTDVVVEEHFFCEGKGQEEHSTPTAPAQESDFMSIPAGMQEELPFL